MLLSYIAYTTLLLAIFALGAAVALVLNAQRPRSWSFGALRFVPLMVDLALIFWVAVLGPHPYDSEKWTVYPVEATFPVVIACHLVLNRRRAGKGSVHRIRSGTRSGRGVNLDSLSWVHYGQRSVVQVEASSFSRRGFPLPGSPRRRTSANESSKSSKARASRAGSTVAGSIKNLHKKGAHDD